MLSTLHAQGGAAWEKAHTAVSGDSQDWPASLVPVTRRAAAVTSCPRRLGDWQADKNGDSTARNGAGRVSRRTSATRRASQRLAESPCLAGSRVVWAEPGRTGPGWSGRGGPGRRGAHGRPKDRLSQIKCELRSVRWIHVAGREGCDGCFLF